MLSERINWKKFNALIRPMLLARGVSDVRETRTPIQKGDSKLKVVILHEVGESVQFFSEQELRLVGLWVETPADPIPHPSGHVEHPITPKIEKCSCGGAISNRPTKYLELLDKCHRCRRRWHADGGLSPRRKRPGKASN